MFTHISVQPFSVTWLVIFVSPLPPHAKTSVMVPAKHDFFWMEECPHVVVLINMFNIHKTGYAKNLSHRVQDTMLM